ncbi:MAG: SWIM zinc finger family protein [Lachnospiraceae bacterium]|nr:SWIM zinc finger family protein [Lachnospiraceae bacterium]
MKLLNLASNNSFWRGIDYHHENRIISWKELDKNCYQGNVKGSNDAVYDVKIDMVHPKKSVCNCPFAEGRRVICKHMVALDLEIFPEKEQQMLDYIEEQNQMYEQEYEQEMQEREEEIREFVMRLSKEELRQMLIQRMIDDLYD